MVLRTRWLAAVAGVLALLVVARGAWAGPPTDQLKTEVDKVLKILEDPEMKKPTKVMDRRAAVRRVADEIFDFTEMARRSLGVHWRTRTPVEQAEFVRLFTDLLERSYITKLELYGGEKIIYIGDTIEADGTPVATVHTKVIGKQGTETPVDYRMLRRGDRWYVYDVSIEGVGLVGNYRTQFNKIITTSSYQELVRKMRAKEAEFDEANKPKKS